ncbi:MAG TPA: U32 family peptidase [Treponemataceae bacterium]|nr:U32 family peptidase [Treponemataceae bacterium]
MAELLAPAGNPEALDAAINEGADAVYLGLKSFNARLRSSNFAWSQFEGTVDALHKRGKKVLVTVNTVLEEKETERMYRFLAYLDRMGPDGLIVQDFGVLNLAREHFPKLRIHASTQMNIASARAANAMSRVGVSRVVLARELGIEEIREIKERTSCELEVFVHGALCVSESGLCLFSSFLGGKSANRGMCAQACRRLYSAEVSGGTRQGYFFSPHDLQLIDRIPDLVQAGVHSFKIEGRMKSAEYVGTVVSAYRYVLDHWQEDRKGSVETAKRILANDFARAKTRYWYDSSKAENFLNPEQAGGTGIFLGKIDRVKTEEDGRLATLKGGSYDPDEGDSLRLHKKDDSGRESHKVKEIREEDGLRWIDIPEGFGTGDSVYLLQTKAMSKRYPRVLPNDLAAYRSQPGGEKLPLLKLDLSGEGTGTKAVSDAKSVVRARKEEIDDFPAGAYVQVSTIEDLFAILTDRPVRAILELNHATIASLLGKSDSSSGAGATQPALVLPFPKREIILSIDPFLPQGIEDGLSTTLDELVENGYTQFIVNNPGHLGMLRNRGLKLVAGPYLYAFNRWSADWLAKQGLCWQITPLENSRENLEATYEGRARDHVFLTVFAYPALFRMRFKLPTDYNFTFFSDRQGGVFKTLSTEDGSFVMPEVPFSIADKANSIRKLGFGRFIIDLSRTKVAKNEYRQIMDSYRKGTALPEVSRFNWKDGFYDPERMEELKQMTERANFRKLAGVKGGGARALGAKASGGKSGHAKPSGARAGAGAKPGAGRGDSRDSARKPAGKRGHKRPN